MKLLHSIISVALAASSLSSLALEKDERESIRTARVYHIMKPERGPLEKMHANLAAVPGERLLAEFQRVAREESADPGSRWEGGDLGFVAEGVMDEQFERAVFSQPIGALGVPERSAFGWHLILVEGVTTEPVARICSESLIAIERATPVMPPELMSLSLRTDNRDFHPEVLKYIGDGWGAPMNMDGNLTYIKVERRSSTQELAKVVLHSELTYAQFQDSPRACRRSSRLTIAVDCAANATGLAERSEYEGRGASGRRLVHWKSEPKLSPVRKGAMSEQLWQMACSR